MTYSNPDAIYTEISHDPSLRITTAHFQWPFAQPTDTYSLERGPTFSVTLDRHMVARPSKLKWLMEEVIGVETLIASCFGEELLDTMISMRRSQDFAVSGLELVLDHGKHLAIARLQADSPSTPPILKLLLNGYIEANDRLAHLSSGGGGDASWQP